jgi:hypothetical protein
MLKNVETNKKNILYVQYIFRISRTAFGINKRKVGTAMRTYPGLYIEQLTLIIRKHTEITELSHSH